MGLERFGGTADGGSNHTGARESERNEAFKLSIWIIPQAFEKYRLVEEKAWIPLPRVSDFLPQDLKIFP
jgi:hypothetical protein